MTDWMDDPQVQREIAVDRLYVDVTEHLAFALEERGITRADLAQLCHVSRSAVTQRLTPRNLTLKVIAETLHELDFGLEIGLVDRRKENATTRLRNYEAEYQHDHNGNVIHISRGSAWDRIQRTRPAQKVSVVREA